MTEQKQMLKRRLECISEHLNVIWVAYIVLTMYLEGNRRWVERDVRVSGRSQVIFLSDQMTDT